MQNKYKMRPYEKQQAIAIVKGYNDYKRYIKDEESRILSFGSGNYESSGGERAYQPHGKGGTSSPTENKALQFERLHNSYEYRCVKAVEKAFDSLPLEHYNGELAKKIRRAIYSSCVKDKNSFNFERSGIIGLERSRFYQLRSLFLISIIKNMKL